MSPATGLHRARASHDPWPLYRARVVHVRDELIEAAGLGSPSGPPLAHWSPSIDVRIGLPHKLR